MTTSSPPTPKKRKRGAQPGNLNARKHGLTPRPQPLEYRKADLTIVDLTAEIHILRQQLQRLDAASRQASSLAETIEIARVIAQTASALSRLIRAQVIVFTADAPEYSPADDFRNQLMQAIDKMANEMYGEENPSETYPTSPPSDRPPAPADPPPRKVSH